MMNICNLLLNSGFVGHLVCTVTDCDDVIGGEIFSHRVVLALVRIGE